MSNPNFKRIDFIRQFVETGLSYTQAELAYQGMITSLERAISTRSKICFASVGALKPVDRPPREVVMGFDRSGGNCKRMLRRYTLGPRVEFKFKLHRAFGQKTGLMP